MENAGYVKALNMCCDDLPLDNVYIRKNFRSPYFKSIKGPRHILYQFDKNAKNG